MWLKERGLKKQRVLGLGSLDQTLPLVKVAPPSCCSVVSGIDLAFREEIDSMWARELQRDEECRQLREQLQAQILVLEEEAAEARRRQEEHEKEVVEDRRRQEVHEKELAEAMKRIRMIEQFMMRSSAQIPLTPADAPHLPTSRSS